MMNRRNFIVTGTAAALAARGATGDKMRFAMSGHEFRHTPPHPEAGIKMTARYGYHGLEPFQEDISKYLDRPPEELKKVLDASGLALATVGSGGQYLDPGKIQETIANNAAPVPGSPWPAVWASPPNAAKRPNASTTCSPRPWPTGARC